MTAGSTLLLLFSGGGGGAPSITVPVNLLAAIIARAKATPALMALLPGGIYVGKVPDEMPSSDTPMLYPVAAINDLSGARDQWNTSGFQVQVRAMQVSFFCAGLDPEGDAKALVEVWDDTFKPGMTPQLVYSRGYVIRCATTDDHLMELDDNAPDGSRLHQAVLDFTCQVGRPATP
jgi:hypothetical protein